MRIYEGKMVFTLVSPGELVRCDSPVHIVNYMKGAFDEDPTVEWFFVLPLNRRLRPLGRVMLTKGTATSSLVNPREVLRPAILSNACSIACVHNHPSGDPSPSAADTQVTRQLRHACQTMDIDLVDHVIIGHPEADPRGVGHYSFREAGIL
jgi:DNA repair protein RadC